MYPNTNTLHSPDEERLEDLLELRLERVTLLLLAEFVSFSGDDEEAEDRRLRFPLLARSRALAKKIFIAFERALSFPGAASSKFNTWTFSGYVEIPSFCDHYFYWNLFRGR